MICPRCRVENRAGRRFCAACGSPLPEACSACGFSNEPGEKFCGGCGVSLAPEARPPDPASRPETYTPKHLAERILTSKSALEGERKQVTVLFADIKSSMELMVSRDPEEARRVLDAVLSRMMEAVHRYEGTVNQVLGDGIMALFGAPVALEDHALRACSAALAMQESIARYAESPDGARVGIRVGLNSGEVVVRAIGSDLHMDYTAVGQTTHLASRMEQLAAPGSALLTGDTLRLAEGYIQVRALGPTPVKGLSEPVPVYELMGTASTRTRLQVSAARGLTPFVGREAEREALPRALARAGAGHGQVVAVVGEPGIGKSRLFWEFTHSPQTDGWSVLESRSTSHGKATPYFPVIDLLKVYFGVEERDEPTKVREKVAAGLLAFGDSLHAAGPPLLTLLSVPVDDPQWESIEPASRRRRIMDSVKRLLLAESQRRPLLLVFDDLQWIDSETQVLLDSMVESLPTARILLLVNYRPGYEHAWGGKTYYTQLRIDPLAPENAEELLLALLGASPDLNPLTETLIERTEGNPFFIEESVRTLVETGVLTGSRGDYRLTKPVSAVQMPATVQAILAARIDRLSIEAKQILQCASVIGKDVPFALLQMIADLPEDTLLSGLNHLQTSEFLYETSLFPDLEYTFKHALTHEVAYRSLLTDRRRVLHARIVSAIERLDATRVTTDHVERLAHHAFRGEVWEKATMYLRQAGAKAQRRSAHREAVSWLELALEALRRLPETRETLEQAIDLRLDLRGSLYPLGELETMLMHLRDAEGLAARLNDARRIGWVSMNMGEYFRQTGQFGEACRLIEQARVTATSLEDIALTAASHHYLALARHALGDYRLAATLLLDAGRAWSRQAREAPGASGGSVTGLAAGSLAINLAWRARCLTACGEFDEGIACGREALAIAEDLASPYGVTAATFALGYLYTVKCEFAEAIPLLERALATARDSQIALYEAHALRGLGRAYTLSGEVTRGLGLLERCVALVESRSILLQHATALAWLGEALLLAGRVDEAVVTAHRALALARERGQRGDEAATLRLLGTIAAERKGADPTDAVRHFDEAFALAASMEMRPLLGWLHVGLGRQHLALGDRDKAADHLVAATSLFCAMDMSFGVRRAVEAMNGLGRILVVKRDNRRVYDYLTDVLSTEEHIEVILDRRQHADGREYEGDRRRRPDADRALPSRGLILGPSPD